MVANKLIAIWKLITSRQYLLIYDGRGLDTAIGGGRTAELRDVMYLTIQVKHAYNQLIEMLEESSAEMGELHSLQEMRNALDKLETK